MFQTNTRRTNYPVRVRDGGGVHTCPLSLLMICRVPCPVPTTISCPSKLITRQVGSEEKVDTSSLPPNTQDHQLTACVVQHTSQTAPSPGLPMKLMLVVQPLNYSNPSLSHKALRPGASRGLRRLVEGLLNAKVRPGGQQEGVTPQEAPAVDETS